MNILDKDKNEINVMPIIITLYLNNLFVKEIKTLAMT